MPSLRCWNSFALLLLVCPLVVAAVDEKKVPDANTPSIISNSQLLRGGRDRNLQECGLDTASNITKRQSILFVDVAGRPGDFSETEESELISKLQPACNSAIDSSYYTWSDTALKDLVGNQLDMSPSELFASTTRNFTLKLKLKMETNLPKTVAPIEDDPFSLFAAQDRDDNSLMSIFSSDCECALPTKEAILLRLQALVEEGNVLPSIDAVYNVRTALQMPCPAPPAANETASNSTATTPTDPSLLTTLAVDIETYEDDNITFGLLGQYMLYTYNALSEERCDGLFRNVHTARMLTFNRTADLPIRGTNTTTETSSQASRWLQAAGGDSFAPSIAPTGFPTPAPTIRGADLFTMVWELEGSCENCAADQQLFDQAMQQSAGRIRVLKQERRSGASASRPSQEVLFETKLPGPPAATSHLSSHRDLGVTTNNERLRCFCPMPLVEEPLSVEDFSERLQSEVSTDSRLNFTVVDVEELRRLACNESDRRTFQTALATVVSGNITEFTRTNSSLVSFVQNSMVNSYNELALQLCDPFARELTAARLVEVVPVPLPSSAPTTQTVGRYLQGGSTPSLNPTTEPTAAPTIFGADLFSLVFSLEGDCLGCPTEFAAFDQATSSSGRRQRQLEDWTGGAPDHHHRWMQETLLGQCLCSVDSEPRAPTLEEFAVEVVEYIKESGLLGENATNTTTLFVITDVEELVGMDVEEGGVSSAPSHPPTKSPTKSPSKSPTDSPTRRPTTDNPTASPTCPDPPKLGYMPTDGQGFKEDLYTGLILPPPTSSCTSDGIAADDCPAVDDGTYEVFQHVARSDECLRIQLQCCRSGNIVVKKGCSQECVGSAVNAGRRACFSCSGTENLVDNCIALQTIGSSTMSIDFFAEAGETYYIYISPGDFSTTCFVNS